MIGEKIPGYDTDASTVHLTRNADGHVVRAARRHVRTPLYGRRAARARPVPNLIRTHFVSGVYQGT